ncbi:hypothetical protein [Kribbella swartbergensis]
MDRVWADAAPGIAYLEGEVASYGGTEPPPRRRGGYLVGTPGDVAVRFIALHEATGSPASRTGCGCRGVSREAAMRSLELVAGWVMAGVRAGVGR